MNCSFDLLSFSGRSRALRFEHAARMALLELNSKGLRSSRIGNPAPARKIGIITRSDRPPTAAAAAFVELLFAAARTKPTRA